MPASTSPTRGPPATTSVKIDDIRPRIESGVAVWQDGRAADGADAVRSAGDARAAIATTGWRSAPSTVMPTPQTSTAADHDPAQPPRPCPSQPLVKAATAAPAESAA